MMNTIKMNCIFESCQQDMINVLWLIKNSDEELEVTIGTWEHNRFLSIHKAFLAFEYQESWWYVKRRQPENVYFSNDPAFKYVASPHQKDTYSKKLLRDALEQLKLPINDDIKSEAEKIDSIKAEARS
jgi:hypothetical protein